MAWIVLILQPYLGLILCPTVGVPNGTIRLVQIITWVAFRRYRRLLEKLFMLEGTFTGEEMKQERLHSMLTDSYLTAMALPSAAWQFKALVKDGLPHNLPESSHHIEDNYGSTNNQSKLIEVREPPSGCQVASLQSPIIMVCGSDKLTIRLMRRALGKDGFTVETVEHEKQALSVYARIRPEIVVLDASTPLMDGIATCARLRNLPGGDRTPIIVITRESDLESIKRAYRAGATDFIVKPINWLILKNRIQNMLRSNQLFKELNTSKFRLTEALRIARVGNWQWNMRENEFHCSDDVYRIFGLKHVNGEMTYKTLFERIHHEDQSMVKEAIEAITRSGVPFSIDHRILISGDQERLVHQQAEAIRNNRGGISEVTGIFQDISYRKKIDEKIMYLAYHDSLTGLPNRLFFEEYFKKVLAQAKRHGRVVGLLNLDLDQFKVINGTLGHNAGDVLLNKVAERISRCVRKSDGIFRKSSQLLPSCVTRFGGDEFSALLTDIKRAEDTAKIAERILSALSEPFEINSQEIFVGASIGITLYPQGGKDVSTLFKTADIAMYQAKNQGRNTFRFYQESIDDTTFERLSMESALRKALGNHEFRLYYQPQLDIRTGKIVGVEALIRWEHPKKGFVLPSDFIPLAEETGFIVPLGEWVLRTACAQNKLWQDAGLPPIRMAVNLSSRQFRQEDLVEIVSSALEDCNLSPNYLELELTEGSVMENAEKNISMLHRLKQMGVRLSIDDFGTGYSSLAYLKRFPIDTLKIDRSFVQDLSENSDDAAIVIAIMAMARSLNIKVIAEGLETDAQLQFLDQLGCKEMQGYLISPPVPEHQFVEFLKNGKRLGDRCLKQLVGQFKQHS